MKKITFFRSLIIVAFALLAGLSLQPGPVRAQSQENFRAVFVWQLERSVADRIESFLLRIDSDKVFDDIPNSEVDNGDYSLLVDYSQNQYQLTFDRSLDVGDHAWQVIGLDATGAAIFTTLPADFSVEGSLVSGGFLSAVWQIGSESLRLLVSTLVGLGTILFFILFILLFVLDVIFSRGGKLFLADSGKARRSGFVFDAASNHGVPFALITLEGTDAQGAQVRKTCVSDVEGTYSGIRVPRGEYTITVSRQGYDFPTKHSRAVIVPPEDYYKGDTLRVIAEDKILDPMIPMDKVNAKADSAGSGASWKVELWQRWQAFSRQQPYFEATLFILSLIGLFVNPSFLYIITAVFYGILVVSRLWKLLLVSPLRGRVVDENGSPVAGAIVELADTADGSGEEILAVADDQGRFSVRLHPGNYRAHAKKNGYISADRARTVNDDQIVTITGRPQNLTLELKQIPKLTEDFFLKE